MDLYHLHQEAEPSDRTALQSVVDHIEAEVARLNALEEHIMCECGPEDERLQARLFPSARLFVGQSLGRSSISKLRQKNFSLARVWGGHL